MNPPRAYPLSLNLATRFELRSYSWGAETIIMGNKVLPHFEGVTNELVLPFAGGAGPTQVGNRISCVGCPHLGLRGRSVYCAHPFWIEMFECPQHMCRQDKLSADYDCPMTGRKSAKEQRRYRVREKARRIFWEYYHESGRNPYREGFTIPNFPAT